MSLSATVLLIYVVLIIFRQFPFTALIKKLYVTTQRDPFIVCLGLFVGFVHSETNTEYQLHNPLGKYPPKPCPVSAGE